MKLKPIKLTFVAIAILLAMAASEIWREWSWREHQLIRQSEPIQTSLESFRQKHGRYPESFAEAGIPPPEEIYYNRRPDGSYDLWFGTTLGESVAFHSTDRKWQ